MFQKLKPYVSKFELFLIIFITLQPIIDVFTTYSLMVLNINITFGVIFRFFVLFLCIIYLIYSTIQTKKVYYLTYLFILSAVIGIGLGINFFTKPIFSLGLEIKFIAKVVYFIITLFTYIIAFTSLSKRLDLEKKLINFVLYSSLIINLVMIISIFTSTSLTSYDSSKVGYTGWFFAGNEIGAILAIIFPIVLLYSINNTYGMKSIINWIPTFFMIFSMFAVGTKVGFAACLLVLLLAFFMVIIDLFKSRKTTMAKTLRLRSTLLLLIIILFIGITPFTPIYKNTIVHLNILGISLNVDTEQNNSNSEHPPATINNTTPNPQEQEITKEKVENLLLSSREIYLDKLQTDFENAPLLQKLFGMGYAGNFTEEAKMVEMDFYDIFFSFGIIGFTVFFLPLLVLFIKILVATFANFNKIFTTKYLMYFSSLLLALGIAFSAGHVLTAPAVSIYISAILGYLVVDLKLYGKLTKHN
ncbi:O-antigen ligase family protein [Fredinandcohnia onubensis]|uniref:O-antigen ligase family protein n=1 Tax=Fredinandcohnia onubensis TaxID=1571209 RepID=UPI000C0BE31F|nr:O-antigen ligase family protein [Fredinandcohnia onubensis]